MLIQEKVKPLQPFRVDNGNIHGHVCIDLHNTKSGFTERIQGDNLVTNAAQDILNIATFGYQTPPYNLLPIATNLLGGLMIFDSNLQANKNNCEFPASAHFVGCAGNVANKNSNYIGTLNTLQSKRLPNGYQTVWDFSTSQANGQIGSLARTSVNNGNNLKASQAITSMRDVNDGVNTLAGFFTDDFKYYAADGKIWQFFPRGSVYTSDQERSLISQTWTVPNDITNLYGYSIDDIRYSFSGGNQLKGYNIKTNQKVLIDRTISGIQWLQTRVINNVMYAKIQQKSVYKIVKSNISDIKNIQEIYTDLDYSNNIFTIRDVLVCSNKALIYLDDTIKTIDFSLPYTYDGNSASWVGTTFFKNKSYDGYGTGDSSYYRNHDCPFIKIADGFLGTIFNLAETVTKTANQTMKITYTLTSV